ncbi:hypothetical protein BZG35_08620 [Brevundimonas sp. LM2]|uniref:FecR family protein n=1 Tax=Brevundimonas sp. LM2 TaxID=1938605 RepID=UPI000983F911|nr:FecR domain-containing protein [Brevundimonas sp. LM2]AQR61708.1 hypothetical protein BZG35_08620 [Brevundimonas sp. LM2]
MTEQDPPVASDEDLDDVALAWVARLTSGEADAHERATFVAWRDADPRHAAALVRARDLWTAIGPELDKPPQPWARPGQTPRAAAGQRDRPLGLRAQFTPGPDGARRVRLRGSLVAQAGRAITHRIGPRGATVAASLFALAIMAGVSNLTPFADLSTGGGERAIETLADGSTVTLGPDTALDVEIGADGVRRVRLDRGEALFDVIHDPARPFLVQSGAGEVRVLGTAFGVRKTGGMTQVTVIRGRVEVRSGTSTRILTPDRSVVYGVTSLGGVRAVDASTALAWTRGRLVFENQSVADVVAELDRFSDKKIVLLNRRAGAKRINAVIDLTRTEQWLAALERSENVSVSHFPGLIVVR